MPKRILKQYHFIFVLAILFCLPCPVKRELKKQLDVPVSEVLKFENVLSVCASTADFKTEKNQKQQQNIDLEAIQNQLIVSEIIVSEINNFHSDADFRKNKIPLFKRHRQYRI
ncbi:MAG: hypothetical protein WDA08_08050 [Weeksellaceae bacterium]|jgi:septal ring factor EnvC (AmiA/AmiB activator)